VRVLAVGSQFPPHHLGGYELIWESATGLLREAGHEVTVLTTDYRLAEPVDAEPRIPVRRDLRWYWHEHGFPRLGARERLALERHNARVLRAAIAEARPEVVSWWSMGGMSLSLIERVRRAGIPSVAALCDDWWSYAPDVDAWTRAFARRPRLARAAAGLTRIPARTDLVAAIGSWVFLSEDLRERARAAGLEPRRARVAHRGAEPIFADAAHVRPGPWRWRLVYLGRIDERKGIDLAIEALPLLPDEATLRIEGAGDEGELTRLRSLADRAGVAGRVVFEQRPRPELPALVADADAVVFPVRWREPWGLVPLEAMAAGTPVVATGRGGSGEYLRHAENALLFDPDEGPAALAAALTRLADDADLRARLRDGGFDTADALDPRGFERAVVEELERAAP
jgi:glycogen(starch) synthase